MTGKVYLNNQIEAEKAYNRIITDNQKEQNTVEYRGKMYTYYGKSNVQFSFCYKSIRVFNFICESLIIPFTLGLILFSKTYRTCLSRDFDKLKTKKGKDFHIYLLKNEPNVFKAPLTNVKPSENIVVTPFSKDEQRKNAIEEDLQEIDPIVEIAPIQNDLPIEATHAAEPQTKEQDIEQLCEKIKNKLGQNVPIVELPKLFSDLESQDPKVVDFAQKVLDLLLEKKVELHSTTLSSFPLWPVDAAAIKKIALEQYSSNNPLLRKRALNACSYLVTCGHKEGFEVAALLAKKNLNDPDEKIQHEGFEYFKLLLQKSKPDLCDEDFALAIGLASKMYLSGTELWQNTTRFFDLLIKNCKEKDILKIKPFIIKAVSYEKNHFVWEWINRIITNHHTNKNLVSIAIEAAENGIVCESPYIRDEVFTLLWRLLSWAPEQSLETALKCILIESKQKEPGIGMIQRMWELLGQNCESHTAGFIYFMEKNRQNYAPSLREAVNNLSNSNSPYAKQQAEEINKYFKRILAD